MVSERVVIKGTADGLIITLGAGDWPSLLQDLQLHLGQKASFFKGGRVGLRVGPRQLTRAQIEAVGQILDRNDVSLWAIESESSSTREATLELGLETSLASRPATPPVEPPSGDEAIVVQRTLRSGQVIKHDGHVVIIGDVNPGAEIHAGGNIIVWGRLRGEAHAGVSEDGPGNKAKVCALQLSPNPAAHR